MAEESSDNTQDIPIERTDLMVFGGSMSSVKEKFIADMKRMDQEMSKLSSDLMHLYTQSSTFHAEVATATESFDRQSHSKVQANWDSLAKSPLIEGEGENRTLKLQFDVSQFHASEVTVKIHSETLVVAATHEEKTDTSSIVRQFYREFKFPKGVDPCSINSTLSKDGVLTVQAPLPQPNKDKGSRCSLKSGDSK